MDNLLQADHVCKSYAAHVALDDVSLSVPEGTIYGLLGPNGAGKTTLIRIINGIIRPDAGRIMLGGRPIDADSVRSLGYLPEERGLYRKLSVSEQAVYLARMRGMNRHDAVAELGRWLRRWDMESWAGKRVEQLSKGMAQKVQFMIAMLHHPRLVILDEPFSGFDPVNAEMIREAIMEYRRGGTTFIFSTHNMAQVELMCDEISLINQSRIVLSGRVDEIRRAHAEHRYRLVCDGGNLSLPDGVEQVGQPVRVADGMSYELLMRPDVSVNSLLAALLGQCAIRSVEEILPSMQDIFIKTVERS